MHRNTLNALRLDRRLAYRRGWTSHKEIEQALEALPDVSHKVAPPEEAEEADEGAEAPRAEGETPAN